MTLKKHITCLPGLLFLAACTPAPTLEDRLGDIGRELGNIFHVSNSGEYRYDFAFDAEFPCSATLTEYNLFDGAHWQRTYRFELSDLLPGELLVARERRRAISYYSEKRVDPDSRTFPPKKINTVRLHGADAARLQPLFDAVIAECTERNTF